MNFKTTEVHIDLSVERVGQVSNRSASMRLDMRPLCFRFIAERARPRRQPSFSRSRMSARKGANCQRQQVMTTARSGTAAENCMVNHTSQYRDKSERS